MINRAVLKEQAKHYLKQNHNQSGMIGVEVMHTILESTTHAALITIVLTAGFYCVLVAGSIILLIPFLGFFIGVPLLLCIVSATDKTITHPLSVGKMRYYMYLRKNGIRTSATTLFESYDHFATFAIMGATRSFWIVWLPTLIYLVIALIAVLIGIVSKRFAMFLLVTGLIPCVILYIYKTYILWPLELVQADHPQLNPQQVIERCKQMTRGHIGDLIVFDLSFLGWEILGALTGKLLSLAYVDPYYNMSKVLVYEELKGRPIVLDGIQNQLSANTGLTIGINPEGIANSINQFGNQIHELIENPKPAASSVAIFCTAGMYNGSKFPIQPDQTVTLGRDGTLCQIVFSQGAEKISRRHCAVVFNSKLQQYEITDYSTNGTYVNGKRIPSNTPVMLNRGAEIALGNENNRFKLL